MSVELDDYDRSILRECPFDLVIPAPRRGISGLLSIKIRAVARMQRVGAVNAAVISKSVMRVTLRDPGRIAIGLPPMETPAAESV